MAQWPGTEAQDVSSGAGCARVAKSQPRSAQSVAHGVFPPAGALAAQVIEPAHVGSDTGSVIQTMENITNFTRALHELQFPQSAIFSVPDIESHGWEERRA